MADRNPTTNLRLENNARSHELLVPASLLFRTYASACMGTMVGTSATYSRLLGTMVGTSATYSRLLAVSHSALHCFTSWSSATDSLVKMLGVQHKTPPINQPIIHTTHQSTKGRGEDTNHYTRNMGVGA